MMISQPEAEDIYNWLVAKRRWTEALLLRLQNCVVEFRLNIEIPQFGSRRNLRRTYTCPFFRGGSKGCSLPRDVKPYGCLGFNPTQPAAIGLNSGCRSDQELLGRQSSPAKVKRTIPEALLEWFGEAPVQAGDGPGL